MLGEKDPINNLMIKHLHKAELTQNHNMRLMVNIYVYFSLN